MNLLTPATGYVVREIAYEGEVGAGRLIPFEPKPGTAMIAVPDSIPENVPLRTMRVNGVSLVRVGIFDGDTVLVRKTYSKREITKDSVCVLYIPSTGEVVAKKVTFDHGNLLLHYCGIDAQPPLCVPASEVQFRGIIIGRSEHRTEWPFVDAPAQMITDGDATMKISPEERQSRLDALIKRFTKETKEEPLPF